ncbi:carbohydrate-binding domain-containing protein [Arthrobacter ginkgonis]|uniref:Carbohydrate-binding domain-containing protein n=1 Tax=Arthrobacter ginkgonis TaxID=1630594 RepID=A0ABP7D7F7_9MICC
MKFPRPLTSLAALGLVLGLAACSADAPAATSAGTASPSAATTSTTAVVPSAEIEEDTHFDADDLVWDAADEIPVTLADGASSGGDGVQVDGDTVTITAAGTYRLAGSLSDGSVVVAAGDQDTVRLILDGVELASSTGSPFVVNSADEAIVYLADGTANSLTDAATYADTGEDAPNAALYSAADLTVAGSGSLTVTGNSNNGITTNDGLVLAGGQVQVTSMDDGIRGKDYVVLLAGDYAVDARGDGVKSDNEEDAGRGWLLVDGGTLTVASGDDGVKAFNLLTVTGGAVSVTESVEGLEASHIAIGGGTVDVVSSDDGVNAAGGTSSTDANGFGTMGGGPMGETVGDYTVLVTGGELTIDSEGDGLDSNGTATISGGTVVVNGPSSDGNGALDVNGDLLVNGGTVAAAGSAGMAVAPSEGSEQSGVQVTFGSTQPAGTVIQLADSDGGLVATFVTTKPAASLVLSADGIVDGGTYAVHTGGTAAIDGGLALGSAGGSLDGSTEEATVTAGEYTSGVGGGPR